MVVSLSSHMPGGFAQLARGKAAASPAAGAAGDAPAPAAATVGETETSLRSLREEFLSRRLQTAEKIVEAMRPFHSLITTPATARPLAATLGHVAREIESVVRDMGRELDRRSPPGRIAAAGTEPSAEAFKPLAALSQQAERTMTAASRLLRSAAAVSDPDPLGRGTVQSVAAETSRTLLRGWEELKGFRTRLAAAQGRTNLIA